MLSESNSKQLVLFRMIEVKGKKNLLCHRDRFQLKDHDKDSEEIKIYLFFLTDESRWKCLVFTCASLTVAALDDMKLTARCFNHI